MAKRQCIHFLPEQIAGRRDLRIFEDIRDLKAGSARCAVHEGSCYVSRDPLFSHIGFSCKNFSKLFNAPDGISRADFLKAILQEGKGSSGQTFRGMIEYAQYACPDFLLWENVEELLSSTLDAFETLHDAFKAVGYVLAVRRRSASQYMLPQKRVRVYGLCVNVEKSGLKWRQALELVQTIMTQVTSCSITPSP